MRRVWGTGLLAALVLSGCGGPPPAPPESGPAPAAEAPLDRPIDPRRIKRLRPALPPGYEIGDVAADAGPAALAGFGPGWTADPPECAALLGPTHPTGTRGISGSGAEGTVYAIVTPADAGADPAQSPVCQAWTMAYRHTVATVHSAPAPPIEGARTAGMVADARTSVESGASTVSQVRIRTAVLDGRLVAVLLITDPQQPVGPLSDDYAGQLLVDAVAQLRAVD